MTLLELAGKHTIESVTIVDEEGNTEIMDWDDATSERFGDITVRRIQQRMWESGWNTIQYPQGSVGFGLVIVVS